MVPVSAKGKDPMSEEMIEQYEKELQEQEKEGTKIRAIILSRFGNALIYDLDRL